VTELLLQNVAVTAGETRILDGIDLSAGRGEIVAIIGPNGAGKTTLLDAISGTAPATSGTISIGGIIEEPRAGKPRAHIGRVFQGSPLPETLTVAEVLRIASGSRVRADALMTQFGLSSFPTRFVAELSTGMRRILDLAVAASAGPSVLLLDEPASGLAQSEIEYLAGVVRGWREQTGGVVVMVEHDAWLVREVADRVVVLEAGRIESDGSPKEVLDHVRARTKPRMRSPADPAFREALTRVGSEAVTPVQLSKRTVSTWTILRLGLREFSAGMASVLLLGVLNRVLKVELGISLGVVAAVLASYNLAAPIALGVGHRSDTRPIFGRRRVPYILGGTLIAGAAVAAAPHVAGRLAGGLDVMTVIGAVALFVAMGIGMYGAGAVFLALLADIVPERERAHAVSLVYIELILGVMAGVALVGGVLDDDAGNLGTLFGVAGLLIVVLSTIAVWGKEPPLPEAVAPRPSGERVTFLASLRTIAAMQQARVFFVFSVATSVFLFLQQAVLEPYGGDVLKLSVTTTSSFNAVMTIGVLAGMYTAGRPFADRYGHKTIARVGILIASVAFAVLAVSASFGDAQTSWFAIFWIGIGTGVFSVAGLALMMGMVDRTRTAMFMGAWTIARAVADATAVAGGGAFFEAAEAITNSTKLGYATVFAVEALGLLACLPLLKRFSPAQFADEVGASGELEPELAFARVGRGER
jgi:BCD family chlorophyll transporter-like MFS transporter